VRRLLVCLAAGATLTACGSTSSSTSASGGPATSTSTTTTTATISPTTSRAPRAVAAGAGCSAQQIAVSVAAGGAGLSHIAVILRFRNRSASACILTGYPGAALAAASGHEVQARRTPSGYLGGLSASEHTPPVLQVRPGATVSALLEGLDAEVAHGGGPCPRYVHLLVTPPNQRVTVRMATPLTRMCAPEIHPVVPGAGGR
jgi:uncharacterized protein DUF4232